MVAIFTKDGEVLHDDADWLTMGSAKLVRTISFSSSTAEPSTPASPKREPKRELALIDAEIAAVTAAISFTQLLEPAREIHTPALRARHGSRAKSADAASSPAGHCHRSATRDSCYDDTSDDALLVFQSLPPTLQLAFSTRDVVALRAALESMPLEEAEGYMRRCVRCRLWDPHGVGDAALLEQQQPQQQQPQQQPQQHSQQHSQQPREPIETRSPFHAVTCTGGTSTGTGTVPGTSPCTAGTGTGASAGAAGTGASERTPSTPHAPPCTCMATHDIHGASVHLSSRTAATPRGVTPRGAASRGATPRALTPRGTPRHSAKSARRGSSRATSHRALDTRSHSGGHAHAAAPLLHATISHTTSDRYHMASDVWSGSSARGLRVRSSQAASATPLRITPKRLRNGVIALGEISDALASARSARGARTHVVTTTTTTAGASGGRAASSSSSSGGGDGRKRRVELPFKAVRQWDKCAAFERMHARANVRAGAHSRVAPNCPRTVPRLPGQPDLHACLMSRDRTRGSCTSQHGSRHLRSVGERARLLMGHVHGGSVGSSVCLAA